MEKIITQEMAPIHEALCAYRNRRIVSFDVPGHKQGKGNQDLTDFLGRACLSVDVNSMKPLDNLSHPLGVIKDAETLAAQAFKASHAFFMVNGTTSTVQSMIMAAVQQGEKIILPRNVHRSAINTLVFTGALPVYVNPGLHPSLGIPLGMKVEDVKKTIREHPDAKAIFLNNPTYYGICSSLLEITRFAKEKGLLVLVDEAHGTHFSFHEDLPLSAMEAGAHMAAVSMHKTGGSLTQSSLLLTGEGVDPHYVRQIINLMQTTSASYLLLSSLDISRRNLSLKGRDIFERVINMADYARGEINKQGGYYAFAQELINQDSIYDFDVTKLSIHTRNIGLAGIEVYSLLRDRYGIQIEFGDIGNILAILSVGDTSLALERLVASLAEIRRLYQKDTRGMFEYEYLQPEVVLSPQRAFFAEKKAVPLRESKGAICGEFLMCYPPGIPILAPGERIQEEALDYIEYAKEKGSLLTGTLDMKVDKIHVLTEGMGT